jgi:hypothetical protein
MGSRARSKAKMTSRAVTGVPVVPARARIELKGERE